MRLHVIVPALVGQRPDVPTLLRQRHELLTTSCAQHLPADWDWTFPRATGDLLYRAAAASEATLWQSLLTRGTRQIDDERFVTCRLDMLCVATFRTTFEQPLPTDYLELGEIGDQFARSIAPQIDQICAAAAAGLRRHLRTSTDSALKRAEPLWSHRVIERTSSEEPLQGGDPFPVAPGLWIADGQTVVDPTNYDVDEVLAALDLATVHWLTIDDLNRELFDHMRRIHDPEVERHYGQLEVVYREAMVVGGMVAAAEMLLEDQRLCLSPTVRAIYDHYSEQWNLERLRHGLRQRSADIIEHNSRRVDYMHAKQAERTNVALVFLALVTLVPDALAAVDFLASDGTLTVRSSARIVAFALIATIAASALFVVLRTERRPRRQHQERHQPDHHSRPTPVPERLVGPAVEPAS